MAEQVPRGNLSYGLGDFADQRAPIDPMLAEPDNVPLSLAQSLQPMPPTVPFALPDEAGSTVRAPSPTIEPDSVPASGTAALLLKFLLCGLALRAAWNWRAMWHGLRRRHHAGAITTADWPPLTIVLPPARTPQLVAQQMHTLLHAGYPLNRLYFMPLSHSGAPLVREDLVPYLAVPVERIVPVSGPSRLHDSLDAMRAAFIHAPTDLMVVADLDKPLPADALKHAVAPFLDPAVGAIQGVRHGRTSGSTLARLLHLARQVQTAQCDPGGHTRLLPGATVVGARRSAWMSCAAPLEGVPPAEVDFVACLARHGWRTAMQTALGDRRASPMSWSDYLRRVRTANVSRCASGDRAGKRFSGHGFDFACVVPLLWLGSLFLSVAMYFAGDPLLASIGLLICSLNSFDANGQATSLLNALVPVRARQPSNHLSLLPLMPLLHLLAALQMPLAWLARLLPANSRARRHVLAHTAQRAAT